MYDIRHSPKFKGCLSVAVDNATAGMIMARVSGRWEQKTFVRAGVHVEEVVFVVSEDMALDLECAHFAGRASVRIYLWKDSYLVPKHC